MKANKYMDDLHAQVHKRFRTLCSMNGLTPDEISAITASYGVQSSKDIDTHDLIDVCGSLQKQLDERTGAAEKAETMDKLRKRCLKALCAYIDAKGIDTSNKIEYAKQMACRSAKKDNFNRLTAAELRGVIGYFNKERETLENAEKAAKQAEWAEAAAKYIRPMGEA